MLPSLFSSLNPMLLASELSSGNNPEGRLVDQSSSVRLLALRSPSVPSRPRAVIDRAEEEGVEAEAVRQIVASGIVVLEATHVLITVKSIAQAVIFCDLVDAGPALRETDSLAAEVLVVCATQAVGLSRGTILVHLHRLRDDSHLLTDLEGLGADHIQIDIAGESAAV